MTAIGAIREEKSKETAGAIRWSIATATVLAVTKIAVALMTHSMAVMASALDSLLDMASSSVNLFASVKAAKPPDDDHAYGHEKIESLASLFQSLLIGFSGLALIAESVKRFFSSARLESIEIGMAVMGFSLFLTLILTLRLRAAADKNKSLILSTETLHYSMDLLTNLGALGALWLVRLTGHIYWDLAISIAIAVYILKTSIGILKTAVDELLDRSLPPVSKEEIETIIRNFSPKIVDFHNFRSRRAGDLIFMDFHIEIKDENDFHRAHDLTEALIAKIQQRYPGADITVHYDPEGAL